MSLIAAATMSIMAVIWGIAIAFDSSYRVQLGQQLQQGLGWILGDRQRRAYIGKHWRTT